MLQRILAVAVLLVAMIAAPGCEDPVTEENYDLIALGMDLNEVEDIMGGSGEIQSAGGVGIDASGMLDMQEDDSPTREYLWESGGKQIIIRFLDDEVVHKRKAGF